MTLKKPLYKLYFVCIHSEIRNETDCYLISAKDEDDCKITIAEFKTRNDIITRIEFVCQTNDEILKPLIGGIK